MNNRRAWILSAAVFAAGVLSATAGTDFSAYGNVIVVGQSSGEVSFGTAPGETPGMPLGPGTAISGQLAVPGENEPVLTGSQGTDGAPGSAGSMPEAAEEGNKSYSPVLIAGDGGAQQPQAPAEEPSGLLTPISEEEQTDLQSQASAEETASLKPQAGGRQIDPGKPMVALTFDDGPQASVGNRIMDCLAQYGGKATFFMVGDRVASHKEEVQRMVAEGHEVANHTMNHKYLQKLGAGEIQAQVTKGNDAIEAVCGVRPKLLRLPGGNHNATVRANTHMPMIQWNIDTLDWKTKNPDKTVAAVLDHVKDGDIVLMHELYKQSGDAALRIIPELHNRGFQMVTVSEMAAARGVNLEAGKLYSSFR